MSDQVIGVTIKGIGDFSDVVSNVGSVQKALTKLKLPDKLGDNLNKNISNFMKEYDKYQKKIAEGIHTQGDQNAVNKSLNSMLNSYEKIVKDFSKLSAKDFKEIFNLDDKAFASVQAQIKNIQAEIKKIKLDPKQLTEPINEISKLTKANSLFGNGKAFDKLKTAFASNEIQDAKEAIADIQTYYDRFSAKMGENKRIAFLSEFDKLKQYVSNADQATQKWSGDLDRLEKELGDIGGKGLGEIDEMKQKLLETSQAAERVTDVLKKQHADEFSFNREAQNIDRQIQSYFGLSQMIRKVGDIAKDAFATVKDLDKAMTETAVVTNFSVGDMWDMLPTYTAQANQLGSTIKDVYEAATLYYQQGLNTNQAMSLANETLKMARIAGLDAAEATNMMTAALRGFNMEINQMSAQKVNDIYSELAAITASDTKEIGSAMERTASIANSANMEFETTSAFLAQMIETTREAPENLGTAMKTIIARFQEMKKDPTKLIDSEGIAMDANKVDTALKTIGVNLMNTKGEFRDLDDVFLDIASRWDSLTQGQQRYIATIAAGSRQQSRFIAMMSNYERTMELVDAANNSAGASQRQFEKTLDSMEAKLNKLKNAWDQFTMGLMNNQILKFGVDALTEGFTIVNKFIDALSKLGKPFGIEGLNKSLLTLVTTLGMLNFGKKASRGLIMGGAGWWKGETGLVNGFTQGWKDAGRTGFIGKKGQAGKQGEADGAEYARGFQRGSLKINLKADGFRGTIKSAYAQMGKKTIGWDTIQANKMAASSPVHEMVEKLLPENAITAEATNQLQKAIDEAGGNVVLGVSNYKKKTGKGKFFTDKEAAELQEQYDKIQEKVARGDGLDEGASKAERFGASIANAGQSLQLFGSYLENTPLAPFGSLLSSVGSLLMGFGSTIGWISATFTAAVPAGVTGLAALKAGVLGLTEALMTSPVFWVVAAIMAVVGAVKLADWAFESNAEKLEKASDAAAAASEAYDSAKQETSELADAISKIQETESTFDGLVAGTAEFNDQLITANEQIMALIDKYPMLMDASKNYVTTDANGLMHISEAGFKAVKEYQKQIQANASAMNLIQTADLNALENQQKAEELRNKVKLYQGQATSIAAQEEYEKNQRQADLLEQRAEAEVELARSNAIRTALTGKEIHDIDALTSIYTNLYDIKRKAAEVEVSGLGKHDIRQRYADYHGYIYDKSTKKITDVEGNEVDYDDKVIKDEVIEQTVLLDFENNASSLEAALSQVDAKFADTLKSTSESSKHFISDVLANNIDTNEDLLEQALSGTDFQDAVNSMTEKEMAAILGINAEAINEENIDAKRDEIVNLLTNNATKIAEAQSESYSELATMMAQSQGWDTITAEQQKNQQEIQKQIKDLTSEQAHMMSNIGSQLKEGAGLETMQSYINHMNDLYTKINEEGKESDKEAAKEIEDIFNSVDLTSATGRLEVYTKLTQSSVKATQDWGEELRATASEANLLGDAFDEFLGGDWLELAEHADDFKNSLGQIDTAGILKASEQSHTLKTMLDSGEVSASGLAMALQGVEDGKYSIGAVNDSVLQLLSSLNRIEDEAMKAHNLIENFDAGIDYGEASDFAKENAEKAQEYWDNGEFGNQQLQNYIKLAAGQERWNKAVQEHHGDLELVEKDLLKYVTTFKDGFQPVIDQLVNGKGIDGDSLNKNIEQAVKAGTLDETLAEKFKQVVPRIEGDNFIFGTEGSKATDLTTEELKTYLEQVYGVSTEYAQLILEEWTNLSPDLAAELSKNDLMEAISTNEFKASHGITESGQTILTDQEIKVLEDAGGTEALEKVAEELGYVATDQKSAAEAMKEASFKVLDENGNRIDNTNDPALLQSYIKTFDKAEKGSIESLFKTGAKELFTNGTLDLSKLIQDTQAHGFDQAQAMQAAWQAYQRGEQLGERTSYEGVELDKGIATYEEFTASIESALEASKWQSIGESIAQGIINFINSQDPGTKETDKDYNQTQQEAKNREDANASRDATLKAYDDVNKFFGKIGEWLTTPVDVEAAQKQKMYAGVETSSNTGKSEGTEKLDAAGDSLTTAASQFATGVESLVTAGTNLNTAASNLTTAAAVIANNSGNNGPTNGSNTVSGVPQTAQPNQSSVGGAIVIDNSGALSSLDQVYQKATETAEKINEGAIFKVDVDDKGLAAAGKNAESVKSAASGTNTINVSAGEVNLDSIQTAKDKIKSDEAKLPVKAKDDTDAGLKAIKNKIKNTSASVTIKATTATSNITVTVKGNAKGQYNHGIVAAPVFGSAARGNYGQVGPKGKGGLTLTGELGYEVAWLPDENRSMILGANGPQMIDLPGNAVVWNHEQSEEILKQKAIPAGSHFRIPQNGGTSGGSGGAGKALVDTAKKTGDSLSKSAEDTSKAIARVLVWWDNAARRAEAIQRKMDGNQREFEKYIKNMQATLKTTGTDGKGNDYIKNIQGYITEQERQLNKATTELNTIDNGTAAKTKKGRKKQYAQGADNIVQVSYKKGKKQKTAYMNTAGYIYQDANGAYQIDQAKLNQVKNREQRKALADSLNKEINDRVSKKNAAEDAIRKAEEALEKMGEELYNTFFAWEVELTRIWNITKQIEATEKNISRAKTFQETLDKQLSTGRAKHDDPYFAQKSMAAFNTGLSESVNKIHEQMDLVEKQKEALQKTLSIEDEKTTLAAVQEKLNQRATLDKATEQKKTTLNQAQARLNDAKQRQAAKEQNIKDLKAKKKKASKSNKKKIQKKIDAAEKELQNIKSEVNTYSQQVNSANAAYQSALTAATNNLNNTEKIGYENYRDALQEQIKAQTEAKKYLTITQNGDGTVSVDFNTEKFEAEKLKGNITEEQGKAIQDYVKEITDNSAALSDAYQSANASINELYDELAQLQNQWAEYANELWDIHDKETKERINNFKTLSDSINKALKKLLDDIKRKLDERRQQEDNRKTELDISQKQQRLAMLQADTSGGHQVEIAQLQKEIAEAQQNYQRSLEDQLIDKLQQQADLAAEQRERQIELEEEIVEGVNNAALVDMWMENPEQFEDDIYEAFKKANDYDKKPKALQDQLDNKFEELMSGLTNNQKKQEAVNEAIDSIEDTVDKIRLSLALMTANISTAKDVGLTVKEAHEYLGASYKDLGDPNKGKYTIQDFIDEGISYEDAKQAFTPDKLKEYEFYKEAATKDIIDTAKLNLDKAWKAYYYSNQHTVDNYNKALATAQQLRIDTSRYDVAKLIAEQKSKEETERATQAAIDAILASLHSLTNSLTLSARTQASQITAIGVRYATGGLADFNGPAWLDGTPSKPELVLNPQDTQNFLALRDVLSKAIGSTNSITNSYGGDNIFEINVNVDKIEKDYDVDRVIEKVKKEITKGAGYRNVTQVRNFR